MQENINRNVLLLDDLAVNNLTPFAERGLVRDELAVDKQLELDAFAPLVVDEFATNELAADEIATSELIAQEALDGRVGSFINAEGLLLPGHLRMQLNEKLLEEARAHQALALKERDILTNEVLINDIDGVDQINGEII